MRRPVKMEHNLAKITRAQIRARGRTLVFTTRRTVATMAGKFCERKNPSALIFGNW